MPNVRDTVYPYFTLLLKINSLVANPVQWQTALNSIFKATHCTSHTELTLKIVNRYYTPARVAGFTPSLFPLCWHDCSHLGSLLLVLWGCPNLTSFCKQIFQLIAKCTGIIKWPDPALALLNIGIDAYPSVFHMVVTHIWPARLVVVRNWKSNLAPNLSAMMRLVDQNCAFERLLVINALKYSSFTKAWSIWTGIKQWF